MLDPTTEKSCLLFRLIGYLLLLQSSAQQQQQQAIRIIRYRGGIGEYMVHGPKGLVWKRTSFWAGEYMVHGRKAALLQTANFRISFILVPVF